VPVRARAELAAPSSEGQRLFQLATADESFQQVADRIGAATKAHVHYWLHGKKKPRHDYATRIELVYGVPRDSWGYAPRSAAELAGAPPPQRPVREGPPPPLLDDLYDVLEGIRVQRRRADLLNSERVKLADTETRLLALRARLEDEAERREGRFVREHPEWRKLRDAIIAALEPYPAALAAVVQALTGGGVVTCSRRHVLARRITADRSSKQRQAPHEETQQRRVQ
jgi:hypothetical protein